MNAEAATPAIEKELRLKFAISGGDSWFKVGGDGANCDAIERVDGGYEIHRGSDMVRVEAADVQYFRQNPRPGFAREQREQAAKNQPTYAEPLPDGTWRCKECGFEAKKLHSLKVHHGHVHGNGAER
jgi:hypothetical protein